MRVVYYHRRPTGMVFSVENYFDGVRRHMPSDVQCDVSMSRFVSKGVWRRALNTLEAPLHQGDINHITGDVHFLSYFLHKPRTVLTVLDCLALHRLSGAKREIMRQLWFALPARRVAAITTISQATKDDLLRFVDFPPERVTVVPVFVNEALAPVPRTFNAEKPRILQIGTTPNKNIERLAEALRGISCHLEIIGELSASQRQAIASSGVEHTVRSRLSNEEIRAAYENCDILTYASTFEGFGMPIVEANTVGRVVVTGNVTSMPEIAGDAACLVDPFDVASIRKGFERVIQDREYRDTLIARGFQNRERFTPRAIAAAYRNIYLKLHREGGGEV